MIRKGIKTIVERSGVPVDVIIECNNGLIALDILKNQHVDLMFTDIRMPKMDGIEIVREVRKLRYKPFVVAISGYDDLSYAVELMRLEIMAKQYMGSDFVECLKNLRINEAKRLLEKQI